MTTRFPSSPASRRSRLITGAALLGALACLACQWAMAQEPSTAMTPQARYVQERAACQSGQTGEDKATCLREAGAALAAARHGQLTDEGSTLLHNATERCRMLPQDDRADCLARIVGPLSPNQEVTVSGSVAGGGDIKETTTTTPGSVIIVMPQTPKK